MGLEMTIEYRNRRGQEGQQSNLKGFARDLYLIKKCFTPEEAKDFLWHAEMANRVAGETINVKFPPPDIVHPCIHFFGVVKDLGYLAKGYAVPTDELFPKIVAKLAFPNINIKAPKEVDEHEFTKAANEIIEASKRFYYLRALQMTLENTGEEKTFDGMGTQLELTTPELEGLILATQEAIQKKFDRLASISSGLTPLRIINNDEFSRQALKQMGGLPNLKRVEWTRTRMRVFQFSNDGLEEVRKAMVTRHQKIRNLRIGVAATVSAGVTFFCAVKNLKPPEITPIPSGTKEQPTKQPTETGGIKYHEAIIPSDDQIKSFIQNCGDCEGATIENTKALVMGDRTFIFWPNETDGKFYARMLVKNEWKKIYGAMSEDGTVFWLLPTGGGTNYGEDFATAKTDLVLWYQKPLPNGDIIMNVLGEDGKYYFYLIKANTPLHKTMGSYPVSFESPEPILPPEITDLQKSLEGTPYALNWNEDRTALVFTYTDPETNEKTEIEGVAFDQTGKMIVTIDGETFEADPETIEIEGQIMTFKDFEGKKWVWDGEKLTEAISEAIQAAMAEFDKYGYDYSTLTFGENEEGKVIATNEDGRVVYEDGLFDERYAVEQAGQLDLMPTDIKPRQDILKATGQYFVADRAKAFEYFGPLYKRVREQFEQEYGYDPYIEGKSGTQRVMIEPEINAWGSVTKLAIQELSFEIYFWYELADGTIHIVPLR